VPRRLARAAEAQAVQLLPITAPAGTRVFRKTVRQVWLCLLDRLPFALWSPMRLLGRAAASLVCCIWCCASAAQSRSAVPGDSLLALVAEVSPRIPNISKACLEAFYNASSADLLRMYDASARLPSGVMQFPPSVWSLGDPQECASMPASAAHYCLGEISTEFDNARYNFGALGMCVPPACQESDIVAAMELIGERALAVIGNFSIFNHTYHLNFSLNGIAIEAHCQRSSPWTVGAIVTLCVIGVLFLCVATGSLIHWWGDNRGLSLRTASLATVVGADRNPVSVINSDSSDTISLHPPGALLHILHAL